MEKSGIASVNIEQACTNFICYRSVYYLAKLSESRHLTCSSTSCRTPSSATLDLQSARRSQQPPKLLTPPTRTSFSDAPPTSVCPVNINPANSSDRQQRFDSSCRSGK